VDREINEAADTAVKAEKPARETAGLWVYSPDVDPTSSAFETAIAPEGKPDTMVAAINRAGTRLARDAAGPERLVAGSVGPLLLPRGSELELDAAGRRTVYREQMTALAEGGVDCFLLETFPAVADLMLPSYTKALSARTAAQAILAAVRGARPGVTVLGAKELTAIVQAKMPQLAPKKPRLR